MKRKNHTLNNPSSFPLKPIPKYLLVSFLWILLFVLISLLPWVQELLIVITTKLTNVCLQIIGLETTVTGNQIALLSGSEMKFSIIPDCTGIYPFLILAALIISYPATGKLRLWGVMGAFATTFLFNYARLTLLIFIGYSSREYFQYAHVFIFQITFILLIVLYFLWWLSWIYKKTKK
ncbi:MAG: archaeosortase/exosortase family protein [Caldisericia bacterium]|nr:archaeosortase/exosortase family protein [Caldisericia bacterium]